MFLSKSVLAKLGAVLVIALGLTLSLTSGLQALDIPARPTSGFILDSADILDDDFELLINSKILELKNQSSNEIGILTLTSGEGIDPADFGVKVGRSWGIGNTGNENGVLILITLEDPKYIQISVGRGLEGVLPDALAGRISRDEIAPYFSNLDYGAGILAGVGAIADATKGEYEPKNTFNLNNVNFFDGLFFLAFIVVGLFSLLARTKGWIAGGVFGAGGGGALGLIKASILLGLVSALIFGVAGLILDYFLSKQFQKHSKLRSKDKDHVYPWYLGGGSGSSNDGGGFSGGSFGGGGGFSGGGGGSSW